MPNFSISDDKRRDPTSLDLSDIGGEGDVLVKRPRCKKCGEPLGAADMGRQYVALECRKCHTFGGI
jgi:phage FluMu protein Com